jgi:hypothetical protein
MWVTLDTPGYAPCYIEAFIHYGRYTAASAAQAQSERYLAAVAPDYRGYVFGITGADKVTGKRLVTEYPYGVNGSTTAQIGGNIEVFRVVDNTWRVKVNGADALTAPIYCGKNVSNNPPPPYLAGMARAVSWGIESDDSNNTFTSGTSIDASLNVGSGYATPKASVDRSSYLNWKANYNSTTGRITLTR